MNHILTISTAPLKLFNLFCIIHTLCTEKSINNNNNNINNNSNNNNDNNAFGDLADLAWGQVVKEPIIREATTSTPALIADLAVRGTWTPQTEALFDIRVIDTDAQSYRHQNLPASPYQG